MNKYSSKISFFIPTLNSEKNLKKCILSILGQKEKYKIFLIDGGSSDNTIKIARELNIKVIKQNKIGLANARNTAINNCKTKFIVFIDSDCYIKKDWTEKIIKNFKEEKITGVCGRLVEKNTTKLADKWRSFHLNQDWGDKKIEPDFLFGSNSIFRLSSLKETGGYDEKYLTNYEDVDISYRIKKKYRLLYEPNAIAYHLREDNLKSILKTTRQWSFYSYPVPINLKNLFMRLMIYNPHFFVKYLIKEIINLRLDLIIINIIQLFYNQIYDIRYYKNGTF